MTCVATCIRDTSHRAPDRCITPAMSDEEQTALWQYGPVYRPGVRAWWHHLWGHRIIGPDLFGALFQRDRKRRAKAWRALWRRGRISSRLRQCDIERDYWKRVALGEPHGEKYGHTL